MGRKDPNPIAAYLLLMHVVPPVAADLPAFGGSQLFALDNYRLLSFCVLFPTALRARRSIDRGQRSPSRMTDLLLLGFGLVHTATFVPPDLASHIVLQDSPTNLLRRAFLDFVDIFVLYYAVSRSCTDRQKIGDSATALCLSEGIMAVVATFEHFKGWLLYTQLAAALESYRRQLPAGMVAPWRLLAACAGLSRPCPQSGHRAGRSIWILALRAVSRNVAAYAAIDRNRILARDGCGLFTWTLDRRGTDLPRLFRAQASCAIPTVQGRLCDGHPAWIV